MGLSADKPTWWDVADRIEDERARFNKVHGQRPPSQDPSAGFQFGDYVWSKEELEEAVSENEEKQ